jgi:hypothetical protein
MRKSWGQTVEAARINCAQTTSYYTARVARHTVLWLSPVVYTRPWLAFSTTIHDVSSPLGVRFSPLSTPPITSTKIINSFYSNCRSLS